MVELHMMYLQIDNANVRAYCYERRRRYGRMVDVWLHLADEIGDAHIYSC